MSKIITLFTKFIYHTAINSCSYASNWGVYQPKEPIELKKLK